MVSAEFIFVTAAVISIQEHISAYSFEMVVLRWETLETLNEIQRDGIFALVLLFFRRLLLERL